MTTSNQLALVTWLAGEFGGQQLGKKAIQKLVHILDEGLNVDTGYSFSLYTYGAFSRDLAGDIDITKSVGGVNIDYISDENRYMVTSGPASEAVLSRGATFLAEVGPKLNQLKLNFLGVTARSLELFSTLLFLMKRSSGDDSAIIDQLLTIKPKYSADETRRMLIEVKRFLKTN